MPRGSSPRWNTVGIGLCPAGRSLDGAKGQGEARISVPDLAPDRPEASVVIPSFESHRTIARCLEALGRQSFRRFETIVVDSSPSAGVEEIVKGRFPGLRYVRRRERLLPHAARNVGAAVARGRLLIFTDPDVYAEPGWVEGLVGAHEETGAVVVGAVACFGRRWLDVGTHFCKYDIWLPGGTGRSVSIAPTVNMLCPRQLFDRLGGFPGNLMLGDTVFSWRLKEAGQEIWFVPRATVHHHHLNSWSGLLRERFERGREFGVLRLDEGGWAARRAGLMLAASLFPLRLVRLLWRGAMNAGRAGLAADLARTLPVFASGQAAWLAGEAMAYAQWLFQSGRR